MSLISCQLSDNVLIIALNRPEKKNAITQSMYQDMADALVSVQTNSQIKCVILQSTSENFTAGNDLVDFLRNPSMAKDSPTYQFLQALVACPVPVIAAVKGFAIGIGSTLLLHCEQVFADNSAMFALPFINLGLVPEAGSSLLLPRQIGYQKAADLLLTGRNFAADEAQEMGFVSQLVSDVNEAALNYARLLSQKPRSALVETKRLLRKDDQGLQQRLHEELDAFVHYLNEPAAREALTAFVEKRKPDFSAF